MKPNSARYAPLKAEVICSAALSRGELSYVGRGRWKFGRRRFSAQTVAALIQCGKAVRYGNIVRAA